MKGQAQKDWDLASPQPMAKTYPPGETTPSPITECKSGAETVTYDHSPLELADGREAVKSDTTIKENMCKAAQTSRRDCTERAQSEFRAQARRSLFRDGDAESLNASEPLASEAQEGQYKDLD